MFKSNSVKLWIYVAIALASLFLLPFSIPLLNFCFPVAFLAILFTLNKQERERMFIYMTLLCSLLMPFSNKWVVFSIGFMLVSWCAMGSWKLKLNNLITSPFFWLFTSVYLMHVLGITYSENQARAAKDLEIKLSLFALPLMLFSAKHLIEKHVQKLLLLFVCGTLVMVLGSILFGFIGISKGLSESFFYYHLSTPWGLNIVYYAMIVNAALVFLIHLIYHNYKTLSKVQMGFAISISLIFVLFIFLSASRMQIIGLIAVLILFSIYLAVKYKKVWVGILMPIFVIGFSLLLISQLKVMERFTGQGTGTINTAVKSTRLQLWQVAIENIKAKPIIGVGTGDVQDALNKSYETKGLTDYLKKGNYNSHNQYLQFGVTFGLIGLMLFLLSLFWPLAIAVKTNYVVYILFLVLMGLSMLTECILQRQAGVVLFAFFNSVLAIGLLNARKF